jgi:hypothetical protein
MSKFRKKDSPPFMVLPEGKRGGEEGRARGRMTEQMMADALGWLENSNRIQCFSQEDSERKDFLVVVKKKRGCQVFTIEVKSSEGERTRYLRRTERMKREGKEVPYADLVIDINKKDTIFTIVERVVRGLNLS